MDSMFHKGTIFIFAALFVITMSFTACGDDDSSSFLSPEKESSDSGSSDSVSSSSTNSSSSAKSSSSTDSKSSSSVTSSSSGTSAGTNSSSTSELEDLSCSPEEEGQILEFTLTGKKYICKNGQLIEIASSSSAESKIPCSEEGKTRRANGENVICHDGYWVPVSSSSAVPTSSYFDMTNQFNEKVSYGEFTDPRDGQKYRTVDMYDDVFEVTYTIFAENLNYGEKILGGTVQGDSTKYCYDDDLWYCDNGWGGLYTWSNAMGFPAVCDSVSMYAEACSQKFVYPSGYTQPQYYVQHQGICPEGWHVASEGEWAYLQHSSVFDLGSKVAGFGNNGSGLSILPTGYWLRYENGTTTFKLIKKQTFFWSPEQSSDYHEKAHLVSIESQGMNRLYEEAKSKRAFPVRCVKNY